MNFPVVLKLMRRICGVLLAGTLMMAWTDPSLAQSRHVVVEFAGSSGGVVAGAGDAWVTDSTATGCDPTTTPIPISCGIDFSTAPSDGNTTAAIDLGFSIKIGSASYHTMFINRFGYVTFGTAPSDGTFTFVSDLAGLKSLLVDSSSALIPFVAPFHANLTVPDLAFSNFAPFSGGASYFRGSGDPIAPYNVSEELPAIAVTWFDASASAIATQMVIYQKNVAGDFYLTLRYGNSDSDPPYDISGTSALPAVAGFALTPTATDQVELAGPLPDAAGYFYEFDGGHVLATSTPLSLSCPSATAQTGTTYSSALVASGGTPPDTFSITVGALPAGLTLDSATGNVTGTPTAGGVVPFTAQVSDSTGVPAGTVTSSCTIAVNQAPAITSGASASFSVGVAGSFTVTASGYPAPTFSATGLPTGLTLSSSGVLSGTPAAGTAGPYAVAITASNGVAPNATQTLQLTVSAQSQSLTVAPSSVSFGPVSQYAIAYKTVTLTNGGTGPVAISRVSVTPGVGTKAIDFAAISGCGSSLAAGKQCRIYVVLFARDLGVLSATLAITDSAAGSPQTVALGAMVTATKHGH